MQINMNWYEHSILTIFFFYSFIRIIYGMLNRLLFSYSCSTMNMKILVPYNTIKTISEPLKILFYLSSHWKHKTSQKSISVTYVTPIFKSENRNDVRYYNPVSVVPTCSKKYEEIMYTHILNQVKHKIADQQHGFLPNRSTTTNLMEYVDFVTNNMTGGKHVDSIFTDFSKAFDRIDHGELISKLRYDLLYRIGSKKLYWMVICLNLFALHLVYLKVQLSSLLFLLFINDLSNGIQSKCSLFADDFKLYRRIDSMNDCRILQAHIGRLSNWCSENKLDLNISKYSVMTFTRKRRINFELYNYNMIGSPLL